MLIEIKGVQFVNKGAELMLYAVLDKISVLWPDAEICIEPDQNSPFLKRAKIGAYQKLRLVKNRLDVNGLTYFLPQRFRKALKNTFGIVTEADVTMVLDASGFLYSDQWNYLPLKQASSTAKRFHQKGKAYILMPQALGAFSSASYQAAAAVLVEHAAIVFARDTSSLAHVKQLNTQGNIILAPDFTNLLKADLPAKYQYLTGQVAIIPNNKMLSPSNKNERWREKYITVLVMAIEAAQQAGQTVFLLNHEGRGDQAICEQINQMLPNALEIVEPEDCLAIKAIIGACAWVVSSRYHGCVSALSQGTPCLGTSWSHKYEALFSDYEQQSWLLDIEQKDAELKHYIQHFAQSTSTYSESLARPLEKINAEAEQVWSIIINTLKSHY